MKKEIKIVIKQLLVTGGNYPINLVNEKFKNSKYREVSNIIFPFGVNES
ncbi:hypothetical protein RZE82_05140 [Mollicutes bacterium LVI A0039]|nr:hypothetical protein RZE82_05140 [Mollicutes bacterium LVI A0039]